MSGMSNSPLETHYPHGSTSKAKGGRGIFVDNVTGDGLEVWVDVHLRDRSDVLRSLEAEGAIIAGEHFADSTSLIVLSARSVHIFNMYCHPDWLRPNAKYMYYRHRAAAAEIGEQVEEVWRSKVLLKEWWIPQCLKAGRFLGESHGWAGCRAGGPPTATPKYQPPLPRPDPLLTPDSSRHSSPVKATSPRPSPTRTAPDILESTLPGNLARQLSPSPEDGSGGEDGRLETDLHAPTMGVRDSEDHDLLHPALRSVSTPAQSAANDVDAMDLDPPTSQDPGTLPLISSKENETPGVGLQQVDQASPDFAIAPLPDQTVTSDIEVEEEIEEAELELGSAGASEDNVATPPEQPSEKAVSAGPSSTQARDATPETSATLAAAPTRILPHSLDDLPSAIGTANADIGSLSQPEPLAGEDQKEDTMDPSILFQDLRFWVDPKRPNRTHLLRSLQRSGGKIVADYADATHVLVHGFDTSSVPDKTHWRQIMQDVVKRGVWFMNVSWALKCLEYSRRFPEAEYHLPGGAPEIPLDTKPDVRVHTRLLLEEIVAIFEEEKEGLKGMTDIAAGDHLAEVRGHFKPARWTKLLQQYRERRKRFSHIPPEPSTSTSAPSSRAEEDPPIPGGSDGDMAPAGEEIDTEHNDDAPLTLATVDSQTLHVLSSAYQAGIAGKRKRKTFVDSYMTQTCVKDPTVWKQLYADYHDQQVHNSHTIEEITSRFHDVKNEAEQTGNKDYAGLIMKANLGFDRDGAKAAYRSWIHGLPPSAANLLPAGAASPSLEAEIPAVDSAREPIPTSTVETAAPAASAPSGGPHGKLYTADIARIFASHANEIDNTSQKHVVSILFEKFGTYEISAWAQLISNWTNGKGRFKGKPLRWNPDAPLAESTVSTSTSPARADPPDTLVPPAAASSIAQTIRKSPRKGTAEVAADGPSQIVVPQGASALSNDEMDHIFKRYSPLVENGMANSELCTVIVNAYASYTARTWGLYYSDWKKKTGRFAGFVPNPNYVPPSRDSTKRRRSTASSSTPSTSGSARKKRRGYSEAEEREMARYIVSRQPEDTRPNVTDWAEFAKKFPSRSAAGYAEHYRGYANKIDMMAHEESSSLGTGEREVSVDVDDSDDDSVIVVEAPGKKKVVEVVDITGLDSD